MRTLEKTALKRYNELAERFRRDETPLELHELMELLAYARVSNNGVLVDRVAAAITTKMTILVAPGVVLDRSQARLVADLIDVVRDDVHYSPALTDRASARAGVSGMQAILTADAIYDKIMKGLAG
jgi:hypothetical protein